MNVQPQKVEDLETTTVKSTATDDAVWIGGYFAYGGSKAEQSCTIYFAIPPGARLGKHVDTAEETQYILSGEGDLLTDDGAQPIRPGDVFVLTEGTSHDLPQHRLRGSARSRLLLQAQGRAALGHRDVAAGRHEGHRLSESRLTGVSRPEGWA